MEKTEAQEMWPQRILVGLLGRMLISTLIVFVFALFQLIRIGFVNNDNLFLLIGSALSIIAAFGYAMAGYVYGATGRKSFFAMLLAAGGFIPWAFGSYLVFYKGFWALLELQNGFSIAVIIESLIFILFGYFIVASFYKITEVDKAFQKMAKEGGLITARDASRD